MNLVPEQTKVEAGGSYAKAELNDRTPLWVGILAWGVAMLSLGLSWWAIDKANAAETQLLLLREDIRQMTIEQAREK
ncbi:MAG TPA: hypothetical protein VEC57_20945 [Candidatus Limnocylindrales bacterium]|nr:hypothetical protein [Candidatus Limnocylindrales bacterium]